MILTNGKNTVQLIHGDSLEILPKLESGYSMIVADPPYASGGGTMREKQKSTGEKYAKGSNLPNFEGDARDQRSWTSWMSKWMSDARNLCVEGAIIAVFVDWRQLPALTDALQWAGWLWRGIVVWDKVNCRPQMGRFKQQCEFIVWGTKGAIPASKEVGVLPGMYSYSMPSGTKRKHQTEKPVQLICDLLKICPKGGKILVPFVGSGTDLEAALQMELDATGLESTQHYWDVAFSRINGLLP